MQATTPSGDTAFAASGGNMESTTNNLENSESSSEPSGLFFHDYESGTSTESNTAEGTDFESDLDTEETANFGLPVARNLESATSISEQSQQNGRAASTLLHEDEFDKCTEQNTTQKGIVFGKILDTGESAKCHLTVGDHNTKNATKFNVESESSSVSSGFLHNDESDSGTEQKTAKDVVFDESFFEGEESSLCILAVGNNSTKATTKNEPPGKFNDYESDNDIEEKPSTDIAFEPSSESEALAKCVLGLTSNQNIDRITEGFNLENEDVDENVDRRRKHFNLKQEDDNENIDGIKEDNLENEDANENNKRLRDGVNSEDENKKLKEEEKSIEFAKYQMLQIPTPQQRSNSVSAMNEAESNDNHIENVLVVRQDSPLIPTLMVPLSAMVVDEAAELCNRIHLEELEHENRLAQNQIRNNQNRVQIIGKILIGVSIFFISAIAVLVIVSLRDVDNNTTDTSSSDNGKTTKSTATIAPSLTPSAPLCQNTKYASWGRSQILLDIMSNVSDAVLLMEDTSPQGSAYTWLLNDPMVENPCTYETLKQRYGLAVFYFSTNGDKWRSKEGWLSDKDECEWYGVTCDDLLTSLDLRQNYVSGTLPVEISTFISLVQVNLEKNLISGSLPTELGKLVELETLDLSQNQITGTLPTELGNLSQLYSINLNRNGIIGSFPTTFGMLVDLKLMTIEENKITGSLPTELGKLVELDTLRLNTNEITGFLPSELGNLAQLSFLSLTQNDISGQLLTEFGNLINMERFSLSKNKLSGTLPTEFGNCVSLTHLDLWGNFLSGTVPTELGNLLQLKLLKLNENNLEGTVPDSICNLNAGVDTDCGRMPSEIECSCCTSCYDF